MSLSANICSHCYMISGTTFQLLNRCSTGAGESGIQTASSSDVIFRSMEGIPLVVWVEEKKGDMILSPHAFY